MTVPDSPARAALLARLPSLGFVPPEDAAPWSLAARSARPAARPRPRTEVEPVAAWEPGSDASAVAAAVAAYHKMVADNTAARRGGVIQWLESVVVWVAGWSTVVMLGLAVAVFAFATVCGCLGSLVR